MLKPTLIAFLLSLTTIPSYAQQVEPLCYIQTTPGGTKLSLDYLCIGQSKVTQKIEQSLQLVNVSSKRRTEYGEAITVVTGNIVNNSGKEINYPNLNYTTYIKTSNGLSEQDSDKEFAKKLTLRPKESGSFEVRLAKRFDVFVVNYLDSAQIKNVDIKTCFAGSSESSSYCNLLDTLSIQRFK